MKPEDLVKTTRSYDKPVLVNVRVAGEDLIIWDELCKRTSQVSDAERMRDAVRLATYLLMTDSELIETLQVFRASTRRPVGRPFKKRS